MGINCSENRTADDGGKGLEFFFFGFFFLFCVFLVGGQNKTAPHLDVGNCEGYIVTY